MKKDLLEQIIRQVLNEGSITVDIETLRPDDERKMATLHTILRMNTRLGDESDKFSAADGFLITIKRVGGRVKDDTTGKKSFEISDSDILQNAIFKLNTLTGQYSKMNSSEYVWLLSHDVNLRKKDIEKAKSSRIMVTYTVQAFYIKRSLIPTILSTSTTGYVDTLSKGALVFDMQKINEKQWIRSTQITPDEASQLTSLGLPEKEIQYKEKSVLVPVLFRYFSNNLYKALSAENAAELVTFERDEQQYGDVHRAMVEAFQQEQNLSVTGNWDDATLTRAKQLGEDSYTFNNTDDLKTRLMLIINTKKEQEQQISSIQVPAEGFKVNATKKNAEFYKVQLAMIKFCKDMGVPSWPINSGNAVQDNNSKKAIKAVSDLETALQNTVQQGTYGEKTQAVVKLCKLIIMQMLPANQQVKLLNSTADLVDQQFVNAIITTKI